MYFGQLPIEIDAESIAAGFWDGVEPGLTRWVNDELPPAMTNAITAAEPAINDLVVGAIQEAIPALKREVAVQSTIPYLILLGTWSFGILAGVWLIARNTARDRRRDADQA